MRNITEHEMLLVAGGEEDASGWAGDTGGGGWGGGDSIGADGSDYNGRP